MPKLSCMNGDEEVAFRHDRVYSRDTMTDARTRLRIGRADADLFPLLIGTLAPPFYLLYVLVVPACGEGEAGRYQSPLVQEPELQEFLERYKTFLHEDGRFNLWVHSPEDGATLIWDKHELIYAYGPLERFEPILDRLGYRAGEPTIPCPHAHHFQQELAEDAREIMQVFEWQWSPLQDQDDQ